MKVRNGFVSNSSSSSYFIKIKNSTGFKLTGIELWKGNENAIFSNLFGDEKYTWPKKDHFNLSNSLFSVEILDQEECVFHLFNSSESKGYILTVRQFDYMVDNISFFNIEN